MTHFEPTTFGEHNFGDFLFGGQFVGDTTSVPALPGYDWQILVRNKNLSIAGPLEVISLEGHPKHLDLGTWLAEFAWDGDLNSPAGRLLLPGAGLVIAVNNKVVMSGPATKVLRIRDGDQRIVQVGGVTDLQVIFDRVASAQPATTAPPYNVQAQDVRGPAAAETVIKAFVNANCGPGAITRRQAPGLSIEADSGRGTSVKGAGAWQQLSQLVLRLALAGGVGVRVVQVGAALQFQVYDPADLTSKVVFGVELGNTAGYSYGVERPSANYLYALGSGTGTARTVTEGSNAPSVTDWGVIESISDSGTSADGTILSQAIQADLKAKAAQYSVGITAVDTAAHQWAPVATDASVQSYDVGDNVGVVIEGVKVVQTITDVGFLLNNEGTRISPVVGTPNFGNPGRGLVHALVNRIKAQDAQLRDLQRRGGD